MSISLARPLAFAASACLSARHAWLDVPRALAATSLPKRTSSRRPRLNHFAHTTPTAAASRRNDVKVERILRDETIYVNSILPVDDSRPVPVTLKAESLGGRTRRVSGDILIPASMPRVWTVLTAFDKLERYMPNIISSDMSVQSGNVYLDQVGIISRKLRLRTRMLLRVTADPDVWTVTYTMVEGRDFHEFVGNFALSQVNHKSVRLYYHVIAVPLALYPMQLVENKMIREVPKMLSSIREESVLGKHVPFAKS